MNFDEYTHAFEETPTYVLCKFQEIDLCALTLSEVLGYILHAGKGIIDLL